MTHIWNLKCSGYEVINIYYYCYDSSDAIIITFHCFVRPIYSGYDYYNEDVKQYTDDQSIG